jgi:hypothetical protein
MKRILFNNEWPLLDYNSWHETQDALHLWLQIVGKVRLKTMPWQNHSWHSTLYLSPSGFTTQAIPYQGGAFQIDFDFQHHKLIIRSTHEHDVSFDLTAMAVADFYKQLMDGLHSIGLDVAIYKRPNELAHDTPFDEDSKIRPYDKTRVEDFWEAMIKINCVFTAFRSTFLGKCSPIHLFWGAFDLAVTRFSGRPAPLHPGGMPNMPLDVMQEAYSQEVSSAGFWPGSAVFPEPAFYAYCYPSPEDFKTQAVAPKEAFYSEDMGEFFLKYSDVRAADDPDTMLRSFLESTYLAAANTGNWPMNLIKTS